MNAKNLLTIAILMTIILITIINSYAYEKNETFIAGLLITVRCGERIK
jgi:hypothetical protein